MTLKKPGNGTKCFYFNDGLAGTAEADTGCGRIAVKFYEDQDDKIPVCLECYKGLRSIS